MSATADSTERSRHIHSVEHTARSRRDMAVYSGAEESPSHLPAVMIGGPQMLNVPGVSRASRRRLQQTTPICILPCLSLALPNFQGPFSCFFEGGKSLFSRRSKRKLGISGFRARPGMSMTLRVFFQRDVIVPPFADGFHQGICRNRNRFETHIETQRKGR